MRSIWCALVAATLSVPAHADWLAGAWPADSQARNGSPAITLNRSGMVALVLPEGVLAQAQAEGVSTESAVRAFLARYAPRLCSGLIDMNVPHGALRVDLMIQRPVSLDEMDGATQEDAAAALNQSLTTAKPGVVPHIDNAFVVDRKRLTVSIDYAPDRAVRCIEPPDVIF
jgi:hypothetical protein